MSLEKPDYTVVYRDGDIEYRQYDAYLVAETIIERDAGYRNAGNEGFRRLFRYIAGGNEAQTKIAMTAPVEQSARPREGEKIAMTAPVEQGVAGDGWRVAFMLPGKYTLETAPVPRDPRIQIREVPARLVAALRFSGRWTQQGFDRQYDKLGRSISAAAVMPLGEFQSAMYDAPYTLPFMRRNEVMVAVDQLPARADTELQSADAVQAVAAN